jgi:hypothetical protein
MKIHFSQIYIRPGVTFPFSHLLQLYLSNEITDRVEPSSKFLAKYGDDYDVIFRISAKKELVNNELKGPTVFEKDRHVEYTVFLPFDVIHRAPDINRSAIEFLLNGVVSVFASLEIIADKLLKDRVQLIERVLSDPGMFRN